MGLSWHCGGAPGEFSCQWQAIKQSGGSDGAPDISLLARCGSKRNPAEVAMAVM